jgi:hypothetical protein
VDLRIRLIAIFFGTGETAYFGWNPLPRSDAELICDGITMILLAMAFLRRGDK